MVTPDDFATLNADLLTRRSALVAAIAALRAGTGSAADVTRATVAVNDMVEALLRRAQEETAAARAARNIDAGHLASALHSMADYHRTAMRVELVNAGLEELERADGSRAGDRANGRDGA